MSLAPEVLQDVARNTLVTTLGLGRRDAPTALLRKTLTKAKEDGQIAALEDVGLEQQAKQAENRESTLEKCGFSIPSAVRLGLIGSALGAGTGALIGSQVGGGNALTGGLIGGGTGALLGAAPGLTTAFRQHRASVRRAYLEKWTQKATKDYAQQLDDELLQWEAQRAVRAQQNAKELQRLQKIHDALPPLVKFSFNRSGGFGSPFSAGAGSAIQDIIGPPKIPKPMGPQVAKPPQPGAMAKAPTTMAPTTATAPKIPKVPELPKPLKALPPPTAPNVAAGATPNGGITMSAKVAWAVLGL